MQSANSNRQHLISESESLLTRLASVRPFEMTIPMVRYASVSAKAWDAIREMMESNKKKLYGTVKDYIYKLKHETTGNSISLQSEFTILKLRFNQILDQMDIFADVLSQRSEHETGIWLSGLDYLAKDGLKAGTSIYEMPELMVYLDRGHGAAIRRARTRLPGGDENPVAVIQIPRERMIGHGIGSSLIHEVGHQAAALLELLPSLKESLANSASNDPQNPAWKYFDRWISEIIADFWAIAQLGVSATLGLMSVVTLPSYFQFRIDLNDPHPAPYVRVQISCMTGKKLFPDPQWDRLWNMWKDFYPVEQVAREKQHILQQLTATMDSFVDLLIHHTNKSLGTKKLHELFSVEMRQPAQLRTAYNHWKQNSSHIHQHRPVELFAIIGQARADNKISSKTESNILKQQLSNWAKQS